MNGADPAECFGAGSNPECNFLDGAKFINSEDGIKSQSGYSGTFSFELDGSYNPSNKGLCKYALRNGYFFCKIHACHLPASDPGHCSYSDINACERKYAQSAYAWEDPNLSNQKFIEVQWSLTYYNSWGIVRSDAIYFQNVGAKRTKHEEPDCDDGATSRWVKYQECTAGTTCEGQSGFTGKAYPCGRWNPNDNANEITDPTGMNGGTIDNKPLCRCAPDWVYHPNRNDKNDLANQGHFRRACNFPNKDFPTALVANGTYFDRLAGQYVEIGCEQIDVKQFAVSQCTQKVNAFTENGYAYTFPPGTPAERKTVRIIDICPCTLGHVCKAGAKDKDFGPIFASGVIEASRQTGCGAPTPLPTDSPTTSPTPSPPTRGPTTAPTRNPTRAPVPAGHPTHPPTHNPTIAPTPSPTWPTPGPTTGPPTPFPTRAASWDKCGCWWHPDLAKSEGWDPKTKACVKGRESSWTHLSCCAQKKSTVKGSGIPHEVPNADGGVDLVCGLPQPKER